MRSLRWTLLTLAALCALPLGAQTAPRASRPGWIGFFAGFEQTEGADRPMGVVLAVAEGSPAARVGLEEGDTLIAVDGRPFTAEALKALSASLRAGERVELTLLRDGARRTLSVLAEARPAAATLMPDPVEVRMGSARRLLRVDSVDRADAPTPPRRTLVRMPETPVAPLPEAERATSFNLHVFRDARTDSLSAALREVERQLVALRSAESVRLRELAARVATQGTQGGRIDATDRALVNLRARRSELTNERALLRRMLERIVAERAEAPLIAMGEPMEWTMEVAPPDAPTPNPSAAPAPTVVVRPMTPYIAGRDRVAGARVTPLNPGLAEYFGTARGVLVVEVAPGTPADEGGLRPGDVLLRVGRTDVDGLEALRRAVAAAPADQPLPVILLRKGARVQLALPR